MAKLWDKGYRVDQALEAFTTGDDTLLDRHLVEADCVASIAHAKMLAKVGILSADEAQRLTIELRAIVQDNQTGAFTVEAADEDCHTAIENRLVEKLGDLGKKIHTCRSRNDQVIAATRVHAKRLLLSLFDDTLSLCSTLRAFAEQHQDVPMVGRTHTQIAMPSSVGLWAGAWLESLLDDLRLLRTAYELNDQCPLGSAASYGVPVPIDREYTAQLLGFAKLQNNVLYANNSRGKIESIILGAAVQMAIDLSRLAQDTINFSLPEFGYFRVPKELCTGSSIMPQKRNPCGLELVRAKTSTILACQNQILGILKGLPSGYNRDFQETKRPFLEGMSQIGGCVRVMDLTFQKLEVCEDKLLAAFTPEVFATDEALRLVVEEKMPFRDAYRQVGTHLESLSALDPREALSKRTHAGAPANLRLDVADEAIEAHRAFARKQLGKFTGTLAALLDLPA
ncbi:MAG: argininosuccinate lyase [Candidatus Brocadiae bacterium]|nr:argininosuccinate lyase [Candidatus Brocadiia bacterium]